MKVTILFITSLCIYLAYAHQENPEKSTEKPTAKPTEKPTEKPTAKPTEKPEEDNNQCLCENQLEDVYEEVYHLYEDICELSNEIDEIQKDLHDLDVKVCDQTPILRHLKLEILALKKNQTLTLTELKNQTNTLSIIVGNIKSVDHEIKKIKGHVNLQTTHIDYLKQILLHVKICL
uniref:Uncharacterized protein LOC114331850 isoform X2 n=1 Tax=Diabrotica virgifera virgifera TaxID=50390 RepID=A0A6P7FWT1_DIAVI